ncbi:MAG: hypothetical protein V7752_17540 [Halopseudomonas sp.]
MGNTIELRKTPEAADFLKIKAETLKISRHTGMLCGRPAPAFRKIGRLVVYEQSVLEEWIKQIPVQTKTTETAFNSQL